MATILAASNLQRTPAAQLTQFKRWAAWYSGTKVIVGFWSVCIDVLNGAVEVTPQTQAAVLQAITNEVRSAGADATDLASSLAKFVRRANPSVHVDALAAGVALLSTRGGLPAAKAIATILRRTDAPRTAGAEFVNLFAARLGPPEKVHSDGFVSYQGSYETEDMRRDRLAPKVWPKLWELVELLKARRVDVKPLLTRMPRVNHRVPEVLTEVARGLVRDGEQSTLPIPSGRLAFHTRVDADRALSAKVGSKVLRVFSSPDTVLFLARPVARWGKPTELSFTGLFAADAGAFDVLFKSGFSSDGVEALVTGAWKEGRLVSAEELGLPKKLPPFMCVTDTQNLGAVVLGRDVKGNVAGVLIRKEGDFTLPR